MKQLIKKIDAKIQQVKSDYEELDKDRAYWQMSGLHDAKEIIKKDFRTDEIMGEVYRILEKMGAKSDLLGTIGSYGDTMSDEDVLNNLRMFNAAGGEKI